MDIRYSVNQRDFKRYTTQEMRDEFLITNLYRPDEVVCVYSHVDRMVTFGCMPVNEEVPLEKGIDVWHNFGTDYILERREIGIFNIGGTASTSLREQRKLHSRVLIRRSRPSSTWSALLHTALTRQPSFRSRRQTSAR